MRQVCGHVAMLALLAVGCGSSRWAMDDPGYAAKYAAPYEAGEKIPRMAKQAVDARYVEGKGGLYVEAAVADEPTSVGGELGAFYYPYSFLEGRVALAGLGTESAEGFFCGVNTGVRIQPPSRLAPFVGVGLFAGYSEVEYPAWNDRVDNDHDFFVDEADETHTDYGLFGTVYPEVGVHYWLSSRLRLTGSGRYCVTTEGRDADFWFVGLGLAWLGGDGVPEPPSP